MIERLRSHLDPIARNSQRWQMWRALAGCWALLIFIGLVLRTATPLHAPWEFWTLVALGIIGVIAIPSHFKKTSIDYIALARQIEQDSPELHAILLTAVEQVPATPGGELNYLQQRVVNEALEYARVSSWGHRNAQRANLMLGANFVLLIAFALTLVSIRPSGRKYNDTWAGVERFGGVAVTPGDTNMERGSGLVVQIRFDGRLPAGATLVVQSTNNNEKRIPLAKNLADPVFGGVVSEVKADLKYHVEFAGEKTRDFKVGVFEYPKLDHADAKITYPAYTGLPEKTIKDTRRVSAVEGSVLDYSFFLNKQVSSAKLVGRDKSVVSLTPDASNATIYHSHFAITQSERYTLLLTDDAGRTNRQPPEFVIEVLTNRPAELKLVTPRGDLRVSPLEEIPFQAEVSDDFGLRSYGIAFQLGDGEVKTVELGKNSGPHEKKQFNYLLAMESLGAQPDQLLSYYIWADDVGADGKVRRTSSDLFFAEVRPFEQIFREGQAADRNSNNSQNGGQPGGQQSPTEKLTDLQKDIMSATWNLKRRETSAKPSASYKADVSTVHDSQQQALEQARSLAEKTEDPRMKGFADAAQKAMEKATAQLADAAGKNSVTPLPSALTEEQSAYQSLLRLQAREYQVARNNRNQQRGQRGGGGAQQRAQDQVDQLDLKQTENRYETQNEAAPTQTPAQRENLQVANRLKELAHRQQDLNDKLKELQTALQEAKTDSQKDEIRDQLKRLRDEQQDLLADVDELRQRMDRPENQSSMSEERQQLDKTRADVQRASEALNQESVPKALASGTRAQRELQQLQDDVRKKNSSQFAEEMRQMRDAARQVAQKQEDLAKKIGEVSDPNHKTLSDSDERRDIATQLTKQEEALTNMFTQMRHVSEESESAEPLLSKELYDTLRKSSPDDLNKQLDFSAELIRRGFLSQATQPEQKARQQIEDLKQGVEHAAESVLGDDTEALRLARRELQTLTDQLDRDLTQTNQNQSTNAGGRGQNGSQRQAGIGRQDGNSNEVREASAGRSGTNANANAGARPGRRRGDGNTNETQVASAQRNGQQGANGQQSGQTPDGERGQNGQRPGQQGQRGQGQQGGGNGQGSGQQQDEQQAQQSNEGTNSTAGQRGQRGQRGQGQGQQQANAGQGQDAQQAQNQSGERAAGAANGGARNGGRNGGYERAGGVNSGREYTGPLVGEDFVNWSDRLRNVEEMVDSPDLQTQVASIRERARIIREEYLKTRKRPDWAVISTQISTPLAEVRNRVDEELARRASKEAVVPLDRDPVPAQFSERVKHYYEQLGKNE